MPRFRPLPARLTGLALAALLGMPLAAPAQEGPFAGAWALQTAASTLSFQTVKNGAKVEQSAFATFTGTISPEGQATIRIALDSIDTKVDLRNVRMRFLYFETFKHPEAVITAQLDAAQLADLATTRRIRIDLPYTLSLHGVTQDRTAPVLVTLIDDSLVSVASVGIIPVDSADFALTEGVTKLQEAAGVAILPTGSVSFDFLFERGATGTVLTPATTALETTGDFDTEACLGRFEILSNAGNISFRSASARLDVGGSAVLDNLFDIVSRCPDMMLEIGGHTDSDGSDATNLALSEKRAAAVVDYLVAKGIPATRLRPQGYGEATPLVPNDSAANMARNRRIEFKVLN